MRHSLSASGIGGAEFSSPPAAGSALVCPHARSASKGTSMILRMAAAGLAGLLAGGGALVWAVSVVSNGTDTGAPVLAALVMWAAGIATTAFGAGGAVFYGIGLAQLCWSDMLGRR